MAIHLTSKGATVMPLRKTGLTMLRTALALLLGVGSSVQLASAFKPNLPPMKDTQVLVVGANGRIGEQVVRKLSNEGYKVRAMVRDREMYWPRKSEMGNGPVEIVVGDVLDKPTLDSAMAGCSACIDCHGVARLVEPLDWLIHPKFDRTRTHPYYVYYTGTRNLIESATAAGCERMVRISGLSVGLRAFDLHAFFINFLYSMAVLWQYESEKLVREAKAKGMDYTVVRPGALTDRKRPPECCLNLAWDSQPTPKAESEKNYRIGRKDVADLLVAAFQAKNAAGATLSCSWGTNPNGPKTWTKLLAQVKPDTSPLPLRRFRIATVSMGGLLVGTFVGVFLKLCFIVGAINDATYKRRYEFYNPSTT